MISVYPNDSATGLQLMVKNLSGTAITFLPVEAYISVSAVEVTGATGVQLGEQYTVTATTMPLTASFPITYVWSSDGQPILTHTNGIADTVNLVWRGEDSVAVTADNGYNKATVRHFVAGVHRLFLPLIRKSETE